MPAVMLTPRCWPALELAPKLPAQLVLCARQYPAAHLRQVSAGAIDVEVEHRHGRPEGVRFPTLARLRRPLQGRRDLFGMLHREDALLQIESVAALRYLGRPPPRRLARCSRLGRRGCRLPALSFGRFLFHGVKKAVRRFATRTEMPKGPRVFRRHRSPNLLHSHPFPRDTLRSTWRPACGEGKEGGRAWTRIPHA
jgi:hypothetical protein